MSEELLKSVRRELQTLVDMIDGYFDANNADDSKINVRQVRLLQAVDQQPDGVDSVRIGRLAQTAGYPSGAMIGGSFKGKNAVLKKVLLPEGGSKIFLTDAGLKLLKTIQAMNALKEK